MNNSERNHRIAQGALIAALYVVSTLAFAPISFGPVQMRVSEALTIMPLFTSAAVPGLFIGCVIANTIGGGIAVDVVFGSMATLIGAWIGRRLKYNRWLVPIPTVISNTLIIPFVLRYGYGIADIPLPLMMAYIAAGEVLGSYVLGELLGTAMLSRKIDFFKTR